MNQNTTQTSFHVHEVLEMLSTVKTPLTALEIQNMVTQNFGPQAQFNSCSMSDITAATILDFFLARNKVVETEPGKFILNTHSSCGH